MASTSADEQDRFILSYKPFFDAIRGNDRRSVQEFLEEHRDAVRVKIPATGKTALHVAILAGHRAMVEDLIKIMTPEDLVLQAKDGSTALADAVCNGTSTDMIELMVSKCPATVEIANNEGMLPVAMAFARGYLKIGRYLFSVTATGTLFYEGGDTISVATVVTGSIRMLEFDIAFDLLHRWPTLAFARDFEGKSPVFTLACTSFAFPSGTHLFLLQRLVYARIKVRDNSIQDTYNLDEACSAAPVVALLKICQGITPITRSVYRTKLMHLKSLRLLRIICDIVKTLDYSDLESNLVREAILEATDRGLVEFVDALAKANPDVLTSCTDDSGMNVFQRAIRSRQPAIYNLLCGLQMREAMLARTDKHGNNALHIAGLLAPSHRLSHIPGAALQMQRELQWFKEVEKIIPRHQLESKNRKRLTPREVFTANHKQLMAEGEKWMKETSSFAIVASSLVVTIMFAAAITIPGGNVQDTGFPIFRDEKLFRVFMISDVLSVFSATASVLEFLGVITSRYAEDDFLTGLPIKMTNGVTYLLVSIATMMIAFCAVIFMMFKKDRLMIILISIVAIIPVVSFTSQIFPLLVEILTSTYGPGIFYLKARHKVIS